MFTTDTSFVNIREELILAMFALENVVMLMFPVEENYAD